MPVEIKVPSVGESITEVVVSAWLKNEGDAVKQDEPVVELETDKATVEVPSPAAGTLSKQLKKVGDSAEMGEVIGMVEEGTAKASAKESAAPAKETKTAKAAEQKQQAQPTKSAESTASAEPVDASQNGDGRQNGQPAVQEKQPAQPQRAAGAAVMPSAQ